MSSIHLHSKLGVNPRIVYIHCRVCGQQKSDSLVLLGSANKKTVCRHCGIQVYGGLRGDAECPACHRPDAGGVTTPLDDYEQIHQNGICSECRELMKLGVVCLSVRDGETAPNPYRTGCMCVLKVEAIRRMLVPEAAENIIAQRVCYIPDHDWDQLGLPRREINVDKGTHVPDSDSGSAPGVAGPGR